MTLLELNKIKELVDSPDVESVLLGYSLLIADPDFGIIWNLYATDTDSLPPFCHNFGEVCNILQKNIIGKVNGKTDIMRDGWNALADYFYRPVADLVIKKMQKYIENQ